MVCKKGGSTDPVNMVLELLSECKDMGFDPKAGDTGYCVLDSDFVASKNKQIALADKIARDNALSLIVSSPCFEIWYLCHYDYSTKLLVRIKKSLMYLKIKFLSMIKTRKICTSYFGQYWIMLFRMQRDWRNIIFKVERFHIQLNLCQAQKCTALLKL